MQADTISAGSHTYVVVMRVPSHVSIAQADELRLNTNTAFGPVAMSFRTRYWDHGLGAPLAGDLQIEASGTAPTLDDAMASFANRAITVLPVIATAANASIDNADVEIAFDNTPGLNARDFFQKQIPDEPPIPPHRMRRLRLIPTVDFGHAALGHPEQERLHRAMEYYRLALANWQRGHETVAVANLFMGIEALVKVAVRRELVRRGLQEQTELAAAMNISIRELDGAVRRTVLFQGDDDTHRKAKNASDGLEHGFRSFDDIYADAEQVRDRTAVYLRSAIFDLAEVDQATRDELERGSHAKPLDTDSFAQVIRGRLIGESADLAAPDQQYPRLLWHPPSLASAEFSPLTGTGVTVNAQFETLLGEGLALEIQRYRPLAGP